MTIKEKIEQEKAYRAYEEAIAREFANSQDGSYELEEDEAKELKHLDLELQVMQVNEEDSDPNHS